MLSALMISVTVHNVIGLIVIVPNVMAPVKEWIFKKKVFPAF